MHACIDGREDILINFGMCYLQQKQIGEKGETRMTIRSAVVSGIIVNIASSKYVLQGFRYEEE